MGNSGNLFCSGERSDIGVLCGECMGGGGAVGGGVFR